MGEKLKLSINDLEIWSENPRHIEETENLNLSENDIINILISVVGYRYMYNLAEDIFKNGLMGNTTPVVVRSNNKYLVYDGNRRISCIKILFNPSILDASNIQLKNLIEKLVNEQANSAARFQKLKEIEVYSTTKEEALEIMDKTHSGIQEGVGTIPWDAYQRDKANSKRGIVDYPNAFKLVYKLGLKKKDIKDEYTSYERIFGNSKFKELFKIENYDEIDNRYLRNIYNLLLRYKREIKNDNGLSRIFNKANEASEEFFEWATPRLFPDDFISIKINIETMEIYKGQQFDATKLKISVLDYDGNLLKIDQDLVLANFLSPSNISYNEIDTNQVGTWKYVVSYKNKQACAFIIINELLDPVISLKHPIINLPYGKSIVDLKNEILFATNSINESIVNEINITSNDSIISNFSFLNTNKIGKHNIVYSYIDAYNKKQASECLIINVYKPTQDLQTEVSETKTLHFDFEEDISKYINNLSYSLKKNDR